MLEDHDQQITKINLRKFGFYTNLKLIYYDPQQIALNYVTLVYGLNQ